MKKSIILLVMMLCIIPFVRADIEDVGSISTDSFFYGWDVALDNILVKLKISNANDVAKERLAELEEARNTDDTEGIEKARGGLNDVEDEVTDQIIVQEIEKENEDIKNYGNFTEQELIDAINSYSKITELSQDISQFGVETEGLKETNFIVTLRDNQVTRITEVEELPNDIQYIKISYSEILLALKDQEYKENKLDKLLRYKTIKEDANSLIDKLRRKGEIDD